MNRLLLALTILLVGCAGPSAASQRFANLREGMTTQELTKLLGQPRKITNQGALRTYDYYFTDTTPPTSYYVILGEDGRVRSFGTN